MFVITDELSCGVCAEGCLACAAESKENGCVSFGAFVGGAVHAENLFLTGEQEVEDREDAFLYFTCITGACEQDQLVPERDGYGIGAAGSATGCVQVQARGGE